MGRGPAGTLNNRGVTLADVKRYEEALADYNRSLELRPDHPVTLTNRGNTYTHMEKYELALADHNRSLELRPVHPDALYNRGITYYHMGKYELALADHNRRLYGFLRLEPSLVSRPQPSRF